MELTKEEKLQITIDLLHDQKYKAAISFIRVEYLNENVRQVEPDVIVRGATDDKVFLASYLFDDGRNIPPEWGLDFYAKDIDEAKLKIQAIKDTLKLDGELGEIIDASDESE